VQIRILTGGVQSDPVSLNIQATAPGIFTLPGSTRAAAQNQDYTLNTMDDPASPGSVMIIYLTGQGLLDNPVATGAAAPDSPLSRPLAEVEATVGGQPAIIFFAGLAPRFVGLMQVNLQIPNVNSGDQPLVITIGGVRSNTALIAIAQ
jgi:uncharacterized protein (TIGR03437 family)